MHVCPALKGCSLSWNLSCAMAVLAASASASPGADAVPHEYRDKIQRLATFVAAAPPTDKKAALEWFQAAGVLGDLRDPGVAAVIVPQAWARRGPTGPIPPLRLPGLPDYPVAVALAKIDLPSVNPFLSECLRTDKSGWLLADVLSAILPTDGILAWIDAFEQDQRHLTAQQHEQLKELRTLAFDFRDSRGTIPPSDQDWAKHPLIVERAKMIAANLDVLSKEDNWKRPKQPTLDALALVGELRAGEASEFLGPRLLAKAPSQPAMDKRSPPGADSSTNAQPAEGDALAEYLVAEALAKIGLPSVAPILKQVASGDDEKRTLQVASLTLSRMMPRTVAAVLADEAILKEQNQLAKQRLKSLRDLLSAESAPKPS